MSDLARWVTLDPNGTTIHVREGAPEHVWGAVREALEARDAYVRIMARLGVELEGGRLP